MQNVEDCAASLSSIAQAIPPMLQAKARAQLQESSPSTCSLLSISQSPLTRLKDRLQRSAFTSRLSNSLATSGRVLWYIVGLLSIHVYQAVARLSIPILALLQYTPQATSSTCPKALFTAVQSSPLKSSTSWSQTCTPFPNALQIRDQDVKARSHR